MIARAVKCRLLAIDYRSVAEVNDYFLVDMMVRAGLVKRWLGQVVSWRDAIWQLWWPRQTDGCGLK
jgi:hypothetical protein